MIEQTARLRFGGLGLKACGGRECAKSYNNHTYAAHQEKKETDATNTVLLLYSMTTRTQPHTVFLCHYQDEKAFASLVLFLFPVSIYLKLSECEFICFNCILSKIFQ